MVISKQIKQLAPTLKGEEDRFKQIIKPNVLDLRSQPTVVFREGAKLKQLKHHFQNPGMN